MMTTDLSVIPAIANDPIDCQRNISRIAARVPWPTGINPTEDLDFRNSIQLLP